MEKKNKKFIVKYTIDKKFESFKINEIKKYLPLEMAIEYFQNQYDVLKERSISSKTKFVHKK